eukprot:CAMPEP_0173382106 /NCGR_PEP_ID=MMETSP1356-20130122/4587_1 /TAXON_ID=77927 ORGANISM="Hemiselmis virescens, Strain PCC157" /NCGR_SAMPLE_ID=MMETSP1356 /ASSEMBLY_ACC=CAM_ASM_000847 /LENGTH=140 /DNA_ID=CAMNT_0014336281 /DNA_START=15 /DNA_END=434 /DNA_ORIENTATION=-
MAFARTSWVLCLMAVMAATADAFSAPGLPRRPSVRGMRAMLRESSGGVRRSAGEAEAGVGGAAAAARAATARALASALVAVPPLAVSAAESVGEDKRVLYTAIYTVAHLPVIVPFLLFWKVDAETKVKGAAVATPFFIAW